MPGDTKLTVAEAVEAVRASFEANRSLDMTYYHDGELCLDLGGGQGLLVGAGPISQFYDELSRACLVHGR